MAISPIELKPQFLDAFGSLSPDCQSFEAEVWRRFDSSAPPQVRYPSQLASVQ